VQVTRTFSLDESLPGGFMGINGAPMDMNVINERVMLGQLEKWVITADWNSHPFHIHGASFQVIGDDVPPQNQGWKDTIHVKDRVELLIKFNFEATEAYPYMYHCHVLEHEDMGMMGQFVVLEGNTVTTEVRPKAVDMELAHIPH
jgi:bilirubin oxidase